MLHIVAQSFNYKHFHCSLYSLPIAISIKLYHLELCPKRTNSGKKKKTIARQHFTDERQLSLP